MNSNENIKTWSDIEQDFDSRFYSICPEECGSEEESAIAFAKILQVIKAGYGGMLSEKEFQEEEPYYVIEPNRFSNKFFIIERLFGRELISFHTKEQAEEFLSYPENVELLKTYYMI